MLRYLNNALEIIHYSRHKKAQEYFIEISCYVKCWVKYKDDKTPSPLYRQYTGEMNYQEFILPTDETIAITWDVGYLNSIDSTQLNKEFKDLHELNRLLASNLSGMKNEMGRIEATIKPKYQHQYKSLLIMNFMPFNEYILIDGRHRYAEYQHYDSAAHIPIYIFNDEQCIYAIPYKNELLAYMIIHNVEVLLAIATGKSQLRGIYAIPQYFAL